MRSVAPTVGGYNKHPSIRLAAGSTVWSGGEAWQEIDRVARVASREQPPIVIIDTYPGVNVPALIVEMRARLPEYAVLNVEDAAARPIEEIDGLIDRNLTADRVFGVMSHFTLDEFYDATHLAALAEGIAAAARPTIVVGWGAALVPIERHVLVLADLARWEIQQRQRAGAPNWRSNNADEDNLRKYKRGFFVEWRVADRHKRTLFERIDFLLDTNSSIPAAGLITGDAFRAAMATATSSPFRVVPFFDPGTWGGQWMKDVLDLDRSVANYAWCFDCVPEENSLLLEADGRVVEVPAMDLVLMQPRELLGAKTFARFGAEFPIRFDFLDTMGGGNLSLQVHPLTDYIQDTFGMHYTQDESYYLARLRRRRSGLPGAEDRNRPRRNGEGTSRREGREPSIPRRRLRQHDSGQKARSLHDPGRNRALFRGQRHGVWKSPRRPSSSPSSSGTGAGSESTAFPGPSTWSTVARTSSGTGTPSGCTRISSTR